LIPIARICAAACVQLTSWRGNDSAACALFSVPVFNQLARK
jgi:hypothetical protein